MSYTFVTDYKDNEVLRNSFNELTQKTFSFTLEDWFRQGFWSEQYIPYSFADNEKIISNVSVNLMDFQLEGAQKHYVQLGTVMTDEAYRGQGLSRFLMEKVIAEYKDKVDGIYLFGNDSVIHFYPKFGFAKGKEYQYSKTGNSFRCCNETEGVDVSKKNWPVILFDMNKKENRQKFFKTAKDCASNARFFMDNFGLLAFWATGPLSNNIYYYSAEDAYIIAENKDENLCIHQIISTHEVELSKIIHAFDSSIRNFSLGFTPKETDGYEVKEVHEEDCTFFYLGQDLESIEKKKLMFPTLSHA